MYFYAPTIITDFSSIANMVVFYKLHNEEHSRFTCCILLIFTSHVLIGVKCDACEANAFRLRRYKCLRCVDFDLCGSCYDKRAEAGQQRKNHPMQCIILESDRKLFFPNAVSFTFVFF